MESALVKKIQLYKENNFSWKIKDMLFINSKGLSIYDLNDEERKIEALALILTAGTEEHDVKKAKDFIFKYMKIYEEIESLILLIIADLKYIHHFMKDNDEEDDEPINELLKNKKDNTEKKYTHDEIIDIEKKNYEYIINVFLDAGYKIEEVLEMDLVNFDHIENYVLMKRERELNENQSLIYNLGILCGIAFHNMKQYPNKPEVIRLRKLTKAEKIAEIQKQSRDFFASMNADMEV